MSIATGEFILIMTLATGPNINGVAIGAAEFADQAACHSAGKSWVFQVTGDKRINQYKNLGSMVRRKNNARWQCMPKSSSILVPRSSVAPSAVK